MSYILGIDEVGRGAWAGPLVVGACLLNSAIIEGLTDSKKLTKKKRKELAEKIKESNAVFGLGWVDNKELDRVGLSESLRLATKRAVGEVQKKCIDKNIEIKEIIIDGNVNFLAGTDLENITSTLKKADLLIKSVSAASILAKVARDEYMESISSSEYSFVDHVGYGTKKHLQLIEEKGVSEYHRLSFRPVAKMKTISTSSSKYIGDIAENKVANYLKNIKRHKIIARNFKTRECEIDIVSIYRKNIYFTEVKYRKNQLYGGGISSLTKKKIDQVKYSATIFLNIHKEYLDYDINFIGAVIEGSDFEIKQILDIN